MKNAEVFETSACVARGFAKRIIAKKKFGFVKKGGGC
jgi:hypothetical protein